MFLIVNDSTGLDTTSITFQPTYEKAKYVGLVIKLVFDVDILVYTQKRLDNMRVTVTQGFNDRTLYLCSCDRSSAV